MTACTERAIYVRGDIRDATRKAKSHDRLYVGSETCPMMIPEIRQVSHLLALGHQHGRPITLVTPPCTNESLTRLEKLLAILPPGTEAVFNDWGVFEVLRQTRCRLVLGRLLVRIPRGFRPAGLGNLSSEMMSFVRHSNLDLKEFQHFLIESGVHRVELDNVVQGYSFQLDCAIRASLYLPYVYIASGRKCLFDKLDSQPARYRSGKRCHRTCRNLAMSGLVANSGDRILISENAHFYENSIIPAGYEGWNVDRIVDCSFKDHRERSQRHPQGNGVAPA